MDIQLLNFESKGDERGHLVALETGAQIPFAIKRVYYIFGTDPAFRRGKHAHKNLKQVAVCVSGRCKFDLFDGQKVTTVMLESPRQGLYIGNMIWREMYDFSPDCVLMVLASEPYSEADYIRDYNVFLKSTQTGARR